MKLSLEAGSETPGWHPGGHCGLLSETEAGRKLPQGCRWNRHLSLFNREHWSRDGFAVVLTEASGLRQTKGHTAHTKQ